AGQVLLPRPESPQRRALGALLPRRLGADARSRGGDDGRIPARRVAPHQRDQSHRRVLEDARRRDPQGDAVMLRGLRISWAVCLVAFAALLLLHYRRRIDPRAELVYARELRLLAVLHSRVETEVLEARAPGLVHH